MIILYTKSMFNRYLNLLMHLCFILETWSTKNEISLNPLIMLKISCESEFYYSNNRKYHYLCIVTNKIKCGNKNTFVADKLIIT